MKLLNKHYVIILTSQNTFAQGTLKTFYDRYVRDTVYFFPVIPLFFLYSTELSGILTLEFGHNVHYFFQLEHV